MGQHGRASRQWLHVGCFRPLSPNQQWSCDCPERLDSFGNTTPIQTISLRVDCFLLLRTFTHEKLSVSEDHSTRRITTAVSAAV